MNNTTTSISFRQWLAQRPYVIAGVITLLLVLWMASGIFSNNHTTELTPQTDANKTVQKILTSRVKVETRYASKIHNSVELYGRTEPDRVTTIKAEIRGKVVEVLAKRGSRVVKGQVIVKLSLNDLPAQLTQAKALLKQREIEYSGTKKLNKSGYQGEVQLAQAFSALEAVKADIARLTIDINNAVIKAPFAGVLNTRYVEVGDYLSLGDDIARVIDLNPMIVRAHVTEHQIGSLSVGQSAIVTLLNKKEIQGEVRYIASVGDDATNTFKVEIAINNDQHQLFSGLSSAVNIPLEEVPAIKISPALLALDEQGNIGVKIVVNSRVNFIPINIIKSESDGIWLTGLGDKADIITLGQGFVRAGDKVEAVYGKAQMSEAKTSSANSTNQSTH
jgi:multidrug efflux system membrane fusion protein